MQSQTKGLICNRTGTRTGLQPTPPRFLADCVVVVVKSAKHGDIHFSQSRMKSITASEAETDPAVTNTSMIYG